LSDKRRQRDFLDGDLGMFLDKSADGFGFSSPVGTGQSSAKHDSLLTALNKAIHGYFTCPKDIGAHSILGILQVILHINKPVYDLPNFKTYTDARIQIIRQRTVEIGQRSSNTTDLEVPYLEGF
jgi:hypothetical protein